MGMGAPDIRRSRAPWRVPQAGGPVELVLDGAIEVGRPGTPAFARCPRLLGTDGVGALFWERFRSATTSSRAGPIARAA